MLGDVLPLNAACHDPDVTAKVQQCAFHTNLTVELGMMYLAHIGALLITTKFRHSSMCSCTWKSPDIMKTSAPLVTDTMHSW